MLHLIQLINESSSMPDTLVPRAENRTLILSGLFAISLVLIAIARISNYKAIGTVVKAFFSLGPNQQLLKENMRIGSLSSILLIANFFIAAYICVFLLCHRVFMMDYHLSMIASLTLPIGIVLFEFISLSMASFVTGEGKTLESAFQTTWIGIEFIGLPLSVLALIWNMNPPLNIPCFAIFSLLIGVRVMHRIIKSGLLVLNRGVAWYYIILYLCTFEILPLIVVYFYFQLKIWRMI